MARPNTKNMNNNSVELATFYVGEALCGMDILKIQEINKLMEMTISTASTRLCFGNFEFTRPNRYHH